MVIDKRLIGPGDGGVSPIAFRLDPASGVPTYLQLVQQVEHALRLGYLKPRGPVAAGPGGGGRPGDQPEHRAEGLPRPGAEGSDIGAARARAPSSTPHSARRRCPSSLNCAGRCVAWLERADAAGLDGQGIVALVTSTLRDFAERRDLNAVAAEGGIPVGTREGSHEHRPDRGPWPPLRQQLGAAGLHPGHPRGSPGRPGRTERRRQVDPAQSDRRADPPDAPARSRC